MSWIAAVRGPAGRIHFRASGNAREGRVLSLCGRWFDAALTGGWSDREIDDPALCAHCLKAWHRQQPAARSGRGVMDDLAYDPNEGDWLVPAAELLTMTADRDLRGAEVARLTAELDEYRNAAAANDDLMQTAHELHGALTAMTAERDRLRSALERIAGNNDLKCFHLVGVARAALAAPAQEGQG